MAQQIPTRSDQHAYYYPLDLMRFAAAASVVAFHLAFYSWASNPSSSTAHAFKNAASFEPALPWTWFGWMGVEIFFVISGFVIANSAFGASAGAFLKSRALRLLPAAWICATITLAVRDIGGVDALGAMIGPYVSSLALYPPGPWIDGVYWSLAVEITFYALVFGLLQFRALHLLPGLAWLLTLCSGGFLLLTQTGLYLDIPGWYYLRAASEPLLMRHGAFFAIGVWLWLWGQRRLGVAGAVGLALAVPVAWLEIWMRGASLQASEAHAAAGQPLWLPILIWTVVTIALAVVARQPAWFAPRSETVRRWLKRVGLATYPLYLVHNDVGATLMRVMVTAGVPKWAALALAILTVVGLAFTVALALEPRLRQAFRRAIDRAAAAWPSPGPAAAPAP